MGEDYGKHLQATQDMLEQHGLHEAQLQALVQRARKLLRRSQILGSQTQETLNAAEKRLTDLNDELSK